MTQNLRIKWLLGLVSANAILAAGALGLGVHQYRSVRVEAESARAEADSAREALRASELDATGLRASLAERKVCPAPPPADSQLVQTLQVIASGQQMLLFQALHPVEQAKPAQISARRAPRRRRRIASCTQP
jgi:hypothetical protein